MPDAPDARASLAGVRVLDLSRVLAGPWATQILGDLGAEIIKIERPGRGDDTRAWGPPFLKDENGAPTSESAYFLSANRNKKSVALDFSKPEGAEILRALALQCDVLIENFKVDGLKPYGLDYETLSARDPRLIYCSITGFGRDGPYARRPGYDLLVQAMGGMMSVTGPAQDGPGGGPQKVGVAVVDLMTGLYAAIGVLAALAHRAATGRGQRVDLALFDVQVAALANQAMNYLVTGASPTRMGNAHPSIAPYQTVTTADGSMILAVGNDLQFAALCRILGRLDWPGDPRFATNPARVAHRDDLIAAIEAVTATRPTAHWIAALEAAGVPCGPVNTIGEVFADPHALARGLRLDLAHKTAGSAPTVKSPIVLSDSPVAYRRGPPLLGEDTDDVLSSLLQLSSGRIADLRARGLV
jgi:crotonobetainyl-CoA:carnitine CoA-transferase CaiB-like acyl-CoA transferase